MPIEFGPKTCRVCLEESPRLQRLDETREEGEETPNEMLIQLLGVSYSKLNDKENIPQGICKTCKVELNMAFQFREKALVKQGRIEEYCRELGMFDEADEMFIKEEDSQGESEIQGEETLYILEEGEPLEKTEGGDYVLMEEGEEQEHELGQEEQQEDQEQEIITDNVEYLEDNYSIDMNPEHSEVHETKSFEETPTQQMVLTEAANASIKSKRGRSRRADNLRASNVMKGGYICDICGNYYEKRGRMMEHRRRHDTVCQYQCELCDAEFHVREQLRKHMYSHTGSKPFKCSWCSRQFFYESVLKAHENVHRGIKPYVCKLCDKPFAYSHSLTKHELIHSDIKLYRCDYCQKDFRLLHHMRQHEETKCHQNAVMIAENARVEMMGNDGLHEVKPLSNQ
ncbi:GL21751 [Drosophila persimilis]|uniref:GL21751 n=1 Tax=Drosophila persimilis TaxID=7234 RepID=B4GER7_DROPE|nr:zinc finger and SCAN domain-containing protein 31 [Drosophila persimilis]EDW34102.1 GL21751 [Drosophila persimilis]